MAWAPYEQWVGALVQRMQSWGLEPGSHIVDAACGSGLSTLPLARMGFHVTGVDRSRGMLELARAEAARERLHIVFSVQDLRDLTFDRHFDALICMHSGLDYLLDLSELQSTFRRIRDCLRPGALLAFDKCLDEPDFYQSPQRDCRELSSGRAVIDYRWDRRNGTFEQDAVIEIHDAAGGRRRFRMLQRMRAVAQQQLTDMVERAGFETLEPHGRFTINDPGMGIFRAV